MALHEDAVDAINDASGRHAGHRAAHAKGTLCEGRFTATTAARDLTRAAHMQGEPVRATVRFSNGGGDPGVPDYARAGRGMAVKLYLPDGSTTDMVALTLPVFFVRTPEDFVEFTRLQKPDPVSGKPDMERLGAWLAKHAEAGPAIQASMSAEPPASYARLAYNGIHSFRWVNADGKGRFIRFRWEPEAGEATISGDEAREGGRDYLREELAERLQREPVVFRLVVAIAARGDSINDPTAAWPEDREHVEVGRLELTAAGSDREADGDVLVFDPTRVTDGIELSDDPILRFRPHAYSVSVERRSGAPHQPVKPRRPARGPRPRAPPRRSPP
jgi:catalase